MLRHQFLSVLTSVKSNSKVLAYLTLGEGPSFGWQMATLLLYLHTVGEKSK